MWSHTNKPNAASPEVLSSNLSQTDVLPLWYQQHGKGQEPPAVDSRVSWQN